MDLQFADTVTIADGARQARLSPHTLRYHIKRGQIETMMTPLGRLVIRESLETFLRSREHAGAREERLAQTG